MVVVCWGGLRYRERDKRGAFWFVLKKPVLVVRVFVVCAAFGFVVVAFFFFHC